MGGNCGCEIQPHDAGKTASGQLVLASEHTHTPKVPNIESKMKTIVSEHKADLSVLGKISGPEKDELLGELIRILQVQINTANVTSNNPYVRKILQRKIGVIETEEFRYEGDLLAGLPNGQGRMNYVKEGIVSEGYFFRGLEDGKGTMKFRDRETFDGYFTAGKKNGPGIYRFQSGETLEGTWQNDQLTGVTLTQCPNMAFYYANYRQGKLQGHYIEMSADSTHIYHELFRQDKQLGSTSTFQKVQTPADVTKREK